MGVGDRVGSGVGAGVGAGVGDGVAVGSAVNGTTVALVVGKGVATGADEQDTSGANTAHRTKLKQIYLMLLIIPLLISRHCGLILYG